MKYICSHATDPRCPYPNTCPHFGHHEWNSDEFDDEECGEAECEIREGDSIGVILCVNCVPVQENGSAETLPVPSRAL